MVHRYKYPIKIYKNTQAPQRTEADTGPRLITGPAQEQTQVQGSQWKVSRGEEEGGEGRKGIREERRSGHDLSWSFTSIRETQEVW